MPENCIMNENDINVLLDHFVGGLESSESANVAQKINSLPVWSKTYNQLNHFFGSLKNLKEQDLQQSAPEGLASKTFQRILEQEKSRRASSEFIANKSESSEQTIQTKSGKRSFSAKPSFLALSTCAGFLFIVTLAFSTSFFNNTIKPTSEFANDNSTINNSTDFAVTGSSQQPSSPLFFCSDSVSETPSQISFSNDVNNLAVNSSEQLVDLTGSSVNPSELRQRPVKMACPDGFVVLSPQPEGRPIIVVQPRHLPGELNSVVNQPNVNFVAPVNYQK